MQADGGTRQDSSADGDYAASAAHDAQTEEAVHADAPPSSAQQSHMERAGSDNSELQQRRWAGATKKLSMALDVTHRFRSLLEVAGAAYIAPSRLTRIRTLGEGAFAEVSLCRLADENGDGEGKEVAVKTLKAELFHNQTDLQDFVKEGVLLESLSHPSIVRVLGLGFDASDTSGRGVKPESMFMVAEVCRGGSLRDIVRDQMVRFSKVVYTYKQALQWSIQIAEGLAYLHMHDPMIIHRDVKLDNVLLSGEEGHWDAKLTDFGLHAKVDALDYSSRSRSIKHLAELDAKSSSPATTPESMVAREGSRAKAMRRLKSMTHTRKSEGRLYNLTGKTGSFLNMAPEVVLGTRYDEKCDIFSLGTVLYELFSKSIAAHDIAYTGAPEEFERYAVNVAKGYRRPHPKHWDPELSQLVTDCMAPKAADRPTAPQVARRLQQIGNSGAIAVLDARGKGCCVVQ